MCPRARFKDCRSSRPFQRLQVLTSVSMTAGAFCWRSRVVGGSASSAAGNRCGLVSVPLMMLRLRMAEPDSCHIIMCTDEVDGRHKPLNCLSSVQDGYRVAQPVYFHDTVPEPGSADAEEVAAVAEECLKRTESLVDQLR